MIQARCKCGNGVFIVMVENVTAKSVDVRYECTLCPREVVFTMPRAEAEAFCAGLNGTFGTDEEGDGT